MSYRSAIVYSLAGILVSHTQFACAGKTLDRQIIADIESSATTQLLPGLIRYQSAITLTEYHFLEGLANHPGVAEVIYTNGRREIRWHQDRSQIRKVATGLPEAPDQAIANVVGADVAFVIPFRSSDTLMGMLVTKVNRNAVPSMLNYMRTFSMEAIRKDEDQKRIAISQAHFETGLLLFQKGALDRAAYYLNQAVLFDRSNQQARDLLKKMGREFKEPQYHNPDGMP